MSLNVGRVRAVRVRPAAALALAGAVAALAGCGGTSSDAPTEPLTDTPAKLERGVRGGAATLLSAADVDSLDPAIADYNVGMMVLQATQRTLYSFLPNDATTLVPDLAKGAPKISDDGRTVTVKIKSGVRFAPPVDREVTSRDVKYALERGFTKQVPSGYAAAYFGSIAGTPAKPNSGDLRDVSGIRTPDDRTLVLELTRPNAGLVSQALVKGITAPVPPEYARRFDRQNPSTYAQHVIATGPYMVEQDASGRVTGWSPGRELRLVRNPNWDPATDFRPAYLDRIEIAGGNTDSGVAARRALSGEGSICCDAGSPPIELLRSALQSTPDQVTLFPQRTANWVALNTTVRPLDNLNVRRALMAGVNRSALRLPRGGPLLGELATGYLPPGLQGYEEAGGAHQGANLDFNADPEGDAEVARRYMLAAKRDGLPIDEQGRYVGDDEILAVAANSEPDDKTAEAFQAEARKLGFDVTLRLVPREVVYTNFCSTPAKRVAVCFVAFGSDTPDPYSMLVLPFDGRSIRREGNLNISQLDDPGVNAAIDRAAALSVEEGRIDAWADVDEAILAQAPAIPYVWSKRALVASKDVQLVANRYSTMPDLSFTSIRK